MRPGSELSYTYHARIRMRERGVSEEEIRKALSEPDSVSPGKGDALIARKVVQGRHLTVVYRELSPGRYLAITVYLEE